MNDHVHRPTAALELIEAVTGFDTILDEHPEMAGCCAGAAIYGPLRCTCWTPIYDLEQSEDLTGPVIGNGHQPAMCADCAYRPGSPERGDPDDAEQLLGHPSNGDVFWCHEGMRRVTEWVHPSGMRLPAGAGDYQPPIVRVHDDLAFPVPYRADGSPGLICHGWAIRRLHHLDKATT